MKFYAPVIAMLTFAAQAHATSYQGTGAITTIRTHDASSFPSTADWFSIEGFSTAGACGKLSGLVVAKIPDRS